MLFVYGNYSGDVLNFDAAAEILENEGIRVKTVVATDDVMSAPRDRAEQRRGVAGNFFVIKIASARAGEELIFPKLQRQLPRQTQTRGAWEWR